MKNVKGGLKLEEYDGRMWRFIFKGLEDRTEEKFSTATELMDAGRLSQAMQMLISVIKEFPQHIDAIHHLATILDCRGKEDESLNLWKQAVEIGKACFPEGFVIGKDLLEWGWLENRPFLRACHGFGLALLARNRVEHALSTFNEMIALNPNDNQGIRGLVIECDFMLKRPDDVLKICEKYKDDGMADTLYGRCLALFQLGRIEDVKKAMKNSINCLPKVAGELIKERHKKPKGMSDYYITWGGDDEAYMYWKEYGKFWEETAGAINFVKDCLESKKQNGSIEKSK